MQTYWKDYQGNDESFWEHEWAKHGTCISTLNPSCYINYQSTQEAVDFFASTVNLFKTLPSYQWLAAAGITPSSSATYTSAAIQSALQAKHGHPVTLGCSKGALNEIWYHYNVQGSVQSGTFQPADPDGSKSTCPGTGVKYLPKSGSGSGGSSPTTTSPSSPSSTPNGGSGNFYGKGYLNVSTGGSQKGCIIGAGTWYTTGTCATFTATASGKSIFSEGILSTKQLTRAGSGFTLSSSKGNCAISNGALTCASSVSTATIFTASSNNVAYSGSTAFYASSIPSGSTQATVYTESKPVSLTISWQAQ